jgi:hypothetical protein
MVGVPMKYGVTQPLRTCTKVTVKIRIYSPTGSSTWPNLCHRRTRGAMADVGVAGSSCNPIPVSLIPPFTTNLL